MHEVSVALLSSPARRLQLSALRDAGMLGALIPLLLFECGNLATTLLILRATQLLTSPQRSASAATSLASPIYAAHNVVAAMMSLLAGRWYDGIGLAESTQSALVAQLLPDRLRGSGFGALGAVQATGDVVATVVAGLLYTLVSPASAFGYAAAWMVAAAVTSGLLQPRPMHYQVVRARDVSTDAGRRTGGDMSQGDVIVSGDDALAAAIIEELRSAGVSVAKLDDTEAGDTETDLAEAGIAEALAVVCADGEDSINLEVALLARKVNPDVRVVARLSNDVVREAFADSDFSGAILDVAELAAPSIVEACLARGSHSLWAAGIPFVVAGATVARDATLRELYGGLAPVAVIRGDKAPTPDELKVCPGGDLPVYPGDWTVMIGTADEAAAFGVEVPRPARTWPRRAVLHRAVDGVRADDRLHRGVEIQS